MLRRLTNAKGAPMFRPRPIPRPTAAALCACLVLSGCGALNEFAAQGPAAQAPAVDGDKMISVLADPRRDTDRERDGDRHPLETMTFFELAPTDTVVEVLPGSGWYTRILLPYLTPEGRYMGLSFPPAMLGDDLPPERRARLADWPQNFLKDGLKDGPEGAVIAAAFHFGSVPDEVRGTADRILFMRSLHHMARTGWMDQGAADAFSLLKPGGLACVEQHRARPDAPDSYATGAKGYLKEADVIAAFERAGFELVARSEINANPKDPADHAEGVWALPPTFREGETNRAAYLAIGESDRMTLKFRKPLD